jgi:hypothetical protein
MKCLGKAVIYIMPHVHIIMYIFTQKNLDRDQALIAIILYKLFIRYCQAAAYKECWWLVGGMIHATSIWPSSNKDSSWNCIYNSWYTQAF